MSERRSISFGFRICSGGAYPGVPGPPVLESIATVLPPRILAIPKSRILTHSWPPRSTSITLSSFKSR